MGLGCDLEVDVNGEEVFLVDKEILSSFSGRLSKLFSRSTATTKLKVLFHDLPGGAEAFELMARFCYNPGCVTITPSNVCLLHCVGHFMEMTKGISHSANLIEQTEKTLEGITYWTWPEILIVLKQCQDLFPAAHSSGILKKCLDSLVARIALASDTSPSTSSPDSSGFRFSCDTKSSESTKTSSYHRYWWFEDLAGLNTLIIRKIIENMVSIKFDQVIISRFLFYYLKSQASNATTNEKSELIETLVNLLFLLDRSSVSCKGLFGVLRVALGVNISKCCRSRLESMIGSQLDQATLDNLLVPSPGGVNILYDVNLVMRFLKSFLISSGQISLMRLRRVGRLMDMYIAEVSPDSCLKPSKFIALLTALPDSARDTYDEIYRAVDIYLQIHTGLSEDEKMKICCALNYEKLSSDICKHLAQNLKFPSRSAIQALLSQQSKLKSLLQDTDFLNSSNTSPCTNGGEANAKITEEQIVLYAKRLDLATENEKMKTHLHCTNGGEANAKITEEQIVLYAKRLDLATENEKMKTHLQGMRSRVTELEKVCQKLQTQIAKIMKAKAASPGNPKSLPKLCS